MRDGTVGDDILLYDSGYASFANVGDLDTLGDCARLLVKLPEFARPLNLLSAYFSGWDFTPEDIYITDSGIKYGDPHEDALGIPIIDLACFGGVT